MPGPLDGIRVLDLTTVVAGPYATMLLGELGADVIKIEPPAGDSMRYSGFRRNDDMAGIFLNLGRNKRSVVLDLTQAEAKAALEALVSSVDVVVHNLRRPAAEKLGLDYQTLRKLNPQLIHTVGLGFGDGGPYSGQPAYDDVIQAMAGPVALMERATGQPKFVPMIFVDKTTGLALSAAVLAALFHRERTGEGQEVTIPMFELLVGFSLVEHLFDATFEPPAGSMGYARVLSPNRRPFETSDGEFICALPYMDKHYHALFAAIDRPDLAADPLFESIGSRAERIDEVYAILADLIAQRTAKEWLDLLTEAQIPSASVNRLEDLLSDPHLEAVDFWDRSEHPSEGAITLPGTAFSFGASPAKTTRPAPRLGEHTTECLLEVGLGPATLDALLASSAAAQHTGPVTTR